MTRATGAELRARKGAYHQISRTYLKERGMPAIARPAKAMMAPTVSKGTSTRLKSCPLGRRGGGEDVLVVIALPQRQLGVEEGEHGRREDVLEDRDGHEAPDHGRVHGLGHALGAAVGRDSLVDADGGDDGTEQDALHLAAHDVD